MIELRHGETDTELPGSRQVFQVVPDEMKKAGFSNQPFWRCSTKDRKSFQNLYIALRVTHVSSLSSFTDLSIVIW